LCSLWVRREPFQMTKHQLFLCSRILQSSSLQMSKKLKKCMTITCNSTLCQYDHIGV
jgi:hypothetical protein